MPPLVELTLDTRRSSFDRHQNYKRCEVRSSNRRLLLNETMLQEVKGINALHLDALRSEFHSKFPESYTATLKELRQTTLPPRRSEASKMVPEDVKSVSCSSVASSDAARQLMKFMCDCSSSEDIEIGGSAPSCSSLELDGDCSNESVGSTSSVALLEWASGGSALDGRTCDPCPLCGGECTGHRKCPGDAYCTCAAQHEWDSPLRP